MACPVSPNAKLVGLQRLLKSCDSSGGISETSVCTFSWSASRAKVALPTEPAFSRKVSCPIIRAVLRWAHAWLSLHKPAKAYKPVHVLVVDPSHPGCNACGPSWFPSPVSAKVVAPSYQDSKGHQLGRPASVEMPGPRPPVHPRRVG